MMCWCCMTGHLEGRTPWPQQLGDSGPARLHYVGPAELSTAAMVNAAPAKEVQHRLTLQINQSIKEGEGRLKCAPHCHCSNLESNTGLFCAHVGGFLVASGDTTAAPPAISSLCSPASLLQNKEEEPQCVKELQAAKRPSALLGPPQPPRVPPCPHPGCFVWPGPSDWVHTSCTLNIERSDLLACQGKHC